MNRVYLYLDWFLHRVRPVEDGRRIPLRVDIILHDIGVNLLPLTGDNAVGVSS